MANMRVYELAKELNITTKDIADLLDNNNKTYKSCKSPWKVRT